MAQYKQEIAATETMEWTSGAGRSLKVTVTLSRMLTDYFGNGDWSPQAGLSGEWEIDTESWIDGKSQGGEWLRDIKQGDVVGCIGKIGLKADRKAETAAMVARLKGTPQYVEQLATRDRAEKVDREYRAHVRKVNDMMTLKGGTY